MARLPGLIDAIAQHDRRGRSTIAHIARQVRTEKLIESSRRGVGAAVMTYRDAATLLLAVCGDSSPQGAVAAARNLQRLQPVPEDNYDQLKRAELTGRLAFLARRASFSETVELLIENAPILAEWHADYTPASDHDVPLGLSPAGFAMEREARKFRRGSVDFTPGFARTVRIVSYVPGFAAEIHLGTVWDHFEDEESFHGFYAPPEAPDVALNPFSDLMVTIEVGLPTLVALHQAVQSA